ncbi:MAG: polyprenyl synthetase family protein [Bdellovibrionota bacterium]|nr:polyprenyl synthetase family protein [Bdellovibrionota bacterium]
MLENTEIYSKILGNLEVHLNRSLPNDPIREAYNYCVLPPGKLFRPKLVYAMASDFSKNFKFETHCDHALLCSFVEIHHAYTLVHDDLPCMDDDDIRRNKPSAQKALGEWKAVLIGDGLLNISYELLSKLKAKNLGLILKLASRCLGPKGLIQGQVLDLGHKMLDSFSSLKKTHEYKTARLIQVSLLLSYLLVENPKESLLSRYRVSIELLKLGKYLGLTFQFLDDLSELTSLEISQHEKNINPWFSHSDKVSLELMKGLEKINEIAERLDLPQFKKVYTQYIIKVTSKVLDGKDNIERNFELHQREKVKGSLIPIVRLLQRVSQSNNAT